MVRVAVAAAVLYYLGVPLAVRVGDAASDVSEVATALLAVAVGVHLVALVAYSVMTRAAMGVDRAKVSLFRLVRIQLVTRAITSVVPGGAAAGPAVGIRLMTNAGVTAIGATTALASAAVVSAFVLNALLWLALVVSIPAFGFNAVYVVAALVGIITMMVIGLLLVSLVEGESRIERLVGRLLVRVGRNPQRVLRALREFGGRLEALLADRRLIARLIGWASANWLLDALSLWLILRAFGISVHPIGVLVAFGVANLLAAVPITPGGVGIVEWAYIPVLVTFGAPLDETALAVAVYRVVQLAFPVVLGALSYAWITIERRIVQPAMS